MITSRLFKNEPSVEPQHLNQVYEAFRTGNYSPEVISILRANNMASIVKNIPKFDNQIILSPALLALSEAKQCSLFHALPAHIKVVNFLFKDMQCQQYNDFVGLMAHSGYSNETSVFNLQWDFHRFPLHTLKAKLLSRAIPRQLEHFNFIHGPSIERVCDDELKAFKKSKLGFNTQVHLDRRYVLRHRA